MIYDVIYTVLSKNDLKPLTRLAAFFMQLSLITI